MAKEKEVGKEPAKSKKMLFIIGIPLLILLVAGIGAGVYFLSAGGSRDASAVVPGDGGGGAPELGPLVDMGSLVVNIAHRDSTRFLKMGITLEVKNIQAGEDIQNRMPQIKDAALLLAGNKTFDDIKDLQGKMQLKADILTRINELTGQEKVQDLFFTDFVVQ